MKTLHPWLATVHAHMLTHGERLSAKDATRMFGVPSGTTAAKLMHSAAGPKGGGWFSIEKQQYEGFDGMCNRCIFTALPVGKPTPSWWSSVNVCSVWQWAEAMR